MSSKEQAVAEIVAEMKSLPEDANWPVLSERVRLLAGIEKARADVRAGRVYTTTEIKADLREWLKKSKYEVIIYWSEGDRAFIAEVPELPGCAADGATHEEALANAQVVIREWIETAKSLQRPIPKPRGRLSFA